MRHSSGKIRLALSMTALWGILEMFLLRLLQFLTQWFPNIRRYFMRFMHGRFGGHVIPFETALEENPSKRTWQTRVEWTKTSLSPKYPDQVVLKKNQVTILPNQEVLNLVLRLPLDAEISDCLCRKMSLDENKPCKLKAPLNTCLTLSLPHSVETATSRNPSEKQLQRKKQLYQLLKKCDEIGLVHQVVFLPSPNYTYVICNCCPCCCEVLCGYYEAKKEQKYYQLKVQSLQQELIPLKVSNDNKSAKKQIRTLKKKIKYYQKVANAPSSPLEVQSAFISTTIDSKACLNCGKCAQRCYFDSRTIKNYKMIYNPENCYGCGLCVSSCPVNNIKLIKRVKQKKMAQGSKGIKHAHPHTNLPGAN